MPIKTVVKMGNKSLANASLSVTNFCDGELISLIDDMRDTMQQYGGVGIAAPQIGCSLRVIIFGFDKNSRYPNERAVPFTILVNPVLENVTDNIIDGWEGCLSVPGLRGLVPRYHQVRYSGYDLNGNIISGVAEGFHARILQHEVDHLDGILFPHRIKDMKSFGYEDELF